MTFKTLNEILPYQTRTNPDSIAYRAGAKTLTFREFEESVNRIGNALLALGVGVGDRIACLTKHHTQCILLSLAACKIGAVCMPVNWRVATDELEHIINNGEARLLVADAVFMPAVQLAKLPLLQKTLCTEGAFGDLQGFAAWFANAEPVLEAVEAQPEDEALQLYSSGTTGLPKGVVLTHRGLLSTCEVVSSVWRFDRSGVFANCLPTFHVAGMTMLLLSLYAGGKTVAFSEFVPAEFINDISSHGITHTFLVPAMLQFMLDVPNVEAGNYRTLSLIAYGGSPISERVLKSAIEVFQCDFLQTYGLTEVSGPVAFLAPEDHDVGGSRAHLLRSAGKAIGGARIRIVDPATLIDVADSDVGEIWIESERNLKEYWRNAKATVEVFPEGRNARGGWFRSGDAGYVQNGYLFINDRVKDMIISGGENIYPAEVENVLMQHPCIADGAVFAVPDEKWGEAVKAAVVVRPGMTLTEQEVISFMRDRLAHYKCPKSVDFLAALPRNPTGKLLKRTLRQPYWEGRDRHVS